jgi:hypothetical protein
MLDIKCLFVFLFLPIETNESFCLSRKYCSHKDFVVSKDYCYLLYLIYVLVSADIEDLYSPSQCPFEDRSIF